MIWNHRWLWQSYSKMNEPHFCSRCGKQLNKVRRADVPDMDTELELIRIYHITDRRLGKTKYRWTEFQCPGCGMRYHIDAVKKLEEER